MAVKKTKIVLDADVIHHFAKGAYFECFLKSFRSISLLY